MTKLRDEVVLTLAAAALDDLGELEPESVWSQVALVAHGGYGRRDVAPYTDVDLMLLHAPGRERARGAAGRAAAARRVRRRPDPRPQRADARAGVSHGLQ